MSDRPPPGPASTSKSSAPDPLLGRTIDGRYTVTGLIARGGMGKVYRAEQAPLGRTVALKVLNPSYAGEQDPEFHKRFFLEASIASKLTHPNTVTIFDYGRTDDDVYYMAMELLEGATLHRALREGGPMPEDRAAHIARQICRSLREAHAHGVIHRDLKPANIFLVVHGDEHDFVKVLDFGLVKNVSESRGEDITQTGLFMGSPKYMAPEQIQGDRVDARTDIYSLGIILYEMLTGRVPFDRSSSVNILMAHVSEAVPPLRTMNPDIQVSEGMEHAVLRCLEKDLTRRFASMDELLQGLKSISPTSSGTQEVRSADASASIPPVYGGPLQAAQRLTPPPPQASGAWPSQTPPAVPDISSFTPPPKSRAPLLAVASLSIGLAVAIGVVGIMKRRGAPGENGAGAGPSTVTTAALAPTPPPSASPPPESLVKVRINTEPDGASVKEDGVEVCSSTPCDVLYRGADADAEREHKLAITRAGFKPELRVIKVGDSPISVKLARSPAGARPPPTPPKPDEGPKGFKDIPY